MTKKFDALDDALERLASIDVNQSMLAKGLGIDRSLVSHWLAGRSMMNYRDALGVATWSGIKPERLQDAVWRRVLAYRNGRKVRAVGCKGRKGKGRKRK